MPQGWKDIGAQVVQSLCDFLVTIIQKSYCNLEQVQLHDPCEFVLKNYFYELLLVADLFVETVQGSSDLLATLVIDDWIFMLENVNYGPQTRKY